MTVVGQVDDGLGLQSVGRPDGALGPWRIVAVWPDPDGSALQTFHHATYFAVNITFTTHSEVSRQYPELCSARHLVFGYLFVEKRAAQILTFHVTVLGRDLYLEKPCHLAPISFSYTITACSDGLLSWGGREGGGRQAG